MMPPSVRILHDRGHLKLCLPNFFEKATLEDIRKVLKILKKHPELNENAHLVLEKFFPAWEYRLSDHLIHATAVRETAKRLDREMESQVAAFGSVATQKMKKELTFKKNNLNRATQVVESAKSELTRCLKIAAEYKEIKNLKN